MTNLSKTPRARSGQLPEHPLVDELRGSLSRPARGQLEPLLRKLNRALLEPPELWGAAEVADHLGIKHTNMYKGLGPSGNLTLPPAAIHLRRGRLWRASDIREFKKQLDAERREADRA